MGLLRCSECGTKYQPLVGGATMNLCGDCISAGLNDGFYKIGRASCRERV